MPLYEYECKNCGQRMERIRKFSDPPLTTCEACNGELEQLLSSPAIQFKGTGWYVTDYARKSSAPTGSSRNEAPASTEKKETPKAGEKASGKSSEPAKASA